MKLSDLNQRLKLVDHKAYDDFDLPEVMRDLSNLGPAAQKALISKSLGVKLDFDGLMEYVSQQFFILRQKDDIGDYSALGFGNHCQSVATWSGHDLPASLDSIDITPDQDGDDPCAKCEHLLRFIEFWMEYYGGNFEDFLGPLEVAEH